MRGTRTMGVAQSSPASRGGRREWTREGRASDDECMTPRVRALFLALLVAGCPVGAAQPLQREGEIGVAPALVREGSRLVDADGVLRASDDLWSFETVHAGKVRTFVLSPCLRLGELEQVVGARGEGRYRLSGRVFVHKGQNYLLLTAFSAPGMDDTMPALEPSVTAADGGRTRGNSAPADDPGARRGATTADARRHRCVAGTTITMTRGRILQNPAGWAYFEAFPAAGALEPDAASTIPVTMLPSLMLEELESLAAFSPEPPVVTLSGEFFAHQGRNYLLPTMYLVERAPSRDAEGALPAIVGGANR